MLKGLEHTYKKLKEEIDNKFTKEDKIELARKRLMTGEDSNFIFEKDLHTQKGLKLVIMSNGSSDNCYFDLALPTISFSTFFNGDFKCMYLSKVLERVDIKSYNSLVNMLKEIISNCNESNILDTYGKLKVIYYNNSLVGIKNNEIVFIFGLLIERIDNIDLCIISDDKIRLRVDNLPITELEVRASYSSSYYWSR